MTLPDDVQRESTLSGRMQCPGCVQAYGGDGKPKKDCPSCGGTGYLVYEAVERVRRSSS